MHGCEIFTLYGKSSLECVADTGRIYLITFISVFCRLSIIIPLLSRKTGCHGCFSLPI